MRRSYLLAVACVSLLPGCSPAPNYWIEATPNQKKILVSFPPLYSFTHAVAGKDAYVLCLLTAQGPHGRDIAPTDIFKVNKADLFIYNGLTLDDLFADKMMLQRKNKSLVRLDVGMTLLDQHPKLILKGDEEWHVLADGSKHKHGEHDPHIWLGPDRAIAMTRIIAEKLADIDPSNKAGYHTRADEYVKKLADLHEEGKQKFKGKNIKMVTMHEAFGYFADAFGITVVASIQKLPGLDPSSPA